jgi:hypothetical protein
MAGKIIFVIVVILVFLALRAHNRKKALTGGAPDDPNIYMPMAAEEAVRYAAGQGKTLDYSPDSVKTVDGLLGALHELREKGHLADKDLNVHALEFGAYVGEVIRRIHGGAWAFDHEVAGPGSFPLHWKSDSFPVGWCGKRIINGDEDNVYFKFQIVQSDQLQKSIDSSPDKGDTAPSTQPNNEK